MDDHRYRTHSEDEEWGHSNAGHVPHVTTQSQTGSTAVITFDVVM